MVLKRDGKKKSERSKYAHVATDDSGALHKKIDKINKRENDEDEIFPSSTLTRTIVIMGVPRRRAPQGARAVHVTLKGDVY